LTAPETGNHGPLRLSAALGDLDTIIPFQLVCLVNVVDDDVVAPTQKALVIERLVICIHREHVDLREINGTA
jgi:hypothetical protein